MSVSDSLIVGLVDLTSTVSRQLAHQIEEFFEWAPIGLKVSQKEEDSKERRIVVETGDDGDPSQKAHRNQNVTAAQALQLQVQTQSIIRTVEDMLKLNRTIKEAHLFGGLRTLGGSHAEAQTEANARKVAEALPKLMDIDYEKKKTGGESK